MLHGIVCRNQSNYLLSVKKLSIYKIQFCSYVHMYIPMFLMATGPHPILVQAEMITIYLVPT